ncbi:hypothetical protein VRK_36150 [Vibrio sp. MEBiC08052]|nr:hypothetical protein VRK_36150 [Vibrio sp. MEBiC08052]
MHHNPSHSYRQGEIAYCHLNVRNFSQKSGKTRGVVIPMPGKVFGIGYHNMGNGQAGLILCIAHQIEEIPNV